MKLGIATVSHSGSYITDFSDLQRTVSRNCFNIASSNAWSLKAIDPLHLANIESFATTPLRISTQADREPKTYPPNLSLDKYRRNELTAPLDLYPRIKEHGAIESGTKRS